MPEQEFETSYPGVTGSIAAVAANGLGTADAVPSENIIRIDQPWEVTVKWDVNGLVVPAMAGDFHLTVYLEALGPGADQDLPNVPGPDEEVISFTSGTLSGLTRSFEHTFAFAAGTPALPTNVRQRLYKMIVAVTYTETDGTPGPMAAFSEGPIVQFYRAV
ncbi:MAG: hypothetical protein JNJ50_00965 [Acidobacteria bacterium]|nr:hypothetical protein [Acidobacteriota bacterium]